MRTLLAFNVLYLFDLAVVFIALAFPIYLVLKMNVRGILLGALFIWVVLFIEGIVLSTFDSQRSSMLDHIWLFSGWLFGLIYCLFIYALKSAYIFLSSKNNPAK